MPSSPQTVPTVVLFDYFLNDAGVAIPNARITVVLNSTKPATTISPLTTIALTQQSTTTDGNGYWQFSLIPNGNIAPANTTYTVQTPDSSYDVTLGSVGPYQSTALGTIVNVPSALQAPANAQVTGTLTVGNLLVAAGEAGIDTAQAGVLEIGGDTATTVEIGKGNVVVDANGNIAAGSLTVLASGPYTSSSVAGGLMGIYMVPMPSGDTTGATDTPKIQAQLTAAGTAGGGLVQLSGTGNTPYWVNAPLTQPNNVWIDLGGSTIKLATNAGTSIFQNSDSTNGNTNLRILNGYLDGNKVNQSAGIVDATMNGIIWYAVTDSLLDNVYVRQCKNKPIYIRNKIGGGSPNSDRVTTRNCSMVDNLGYPGFYGDRSVVEGCNSIRNESISADSYNVGGIACRFANNLSYNPGLNPTGDGWAVDACYDSVFEGNICYLTTSGVRMYNTAGNSHLTITGNRFYGLGATGGFYGVLCDARGGGTTAPAGRGRHTIADNYIDNFLDAGTGFGIFLAGGSADIHDNTITNCRVPVSILANNVPAGYLHNNPGYNPLGATNMPSGQPAIPTSGVLTGNPTNFDCDVYIKGGTGAVSQISIGGLPLPVNATHTTATTGGSLVPGTYWYRITARNNAGETLASVETSIVVPAGTNTNVVNVAWTAIPGAKDYRVFGRTTGAELLMGSTEGFYLASATTLYFLDDGSVTPSGALPGGDTTGSSATGMTLASTVVGTVFVPWGSSITLTYGAAAPTWVWYAR